MAATITHLPDKTADTLDLAAVAARALDLTTAQAERLPVLAAMVAALESPQ